MAIDDQPVHAVSALAARAGERLLGIYEGEFTIDRKADDSLVTSADVAANETIVSGLKDLGAGWPILSEESKLPPYHVRSGWRRYWLVDPLDGTRQFVNRTGEFVVNIALVDDTHPVLGVVYVPVTGVCYAARAGGGASKREGKSAPRPIRTRAWRDSEITLVTGRSRSNPLTRAFIEGLAPARVLPLGSAMKSCLIAEGKADVQPGFSRTSHWDIAAPQCIVEEAGGRVMDTEGHRLRYNLGPSLENHRFLVVGDPSVDWRRWLPPELVATGAKRSGPGSD